MAEWAATFHATFEDDREFNIAFSENAPFSTDFGEVIQIDRHFDPYRGDYDITPNYSDQILATRNKVMTDNVTVYQIPVNVTTNPQGGNTVVIGG